MFSQTSRRTYNTTFIMNIPPPPIQYSRTPSLPPSQSTQTEKKKMIWGEPTWWFLHTIAHKVNDFNKVRSGLLDIIYRTCTNLPCPICANHAKSYLNSINFNTIKTQEELKQMLFTFHNVVNAKKNVPLFSISELDSKYSLANTRNIFNNFILHFRDHYRSPGLISDDLFRQRLSNQFVEWFNKNAVYFDP